MERPENPPSDDYLLALSAKTELQILYVDHSIIIVNKPFGLNTIPGNSLVKEETINPNGSGSSSTRGAAQDTNDITSSTEQFMSKKRERTHQELWMDMLTQDRISLEQSMNMPADSHLAQYFASLMAHKSSVPRKRQTFLDWGLRTLKAEREDLVVLYECLNRAFEAREGQRADSVQTRLLHVFQVIKTVHRLDCETSGVCVLARTLEAARSLSTQFREKRVTKRYIALVDSNLQWPQDQGEIFLPIRPDRETRPKQMIDAKDGKDCRTLFRVLGTQRMGDEEVCRVELTPLTGRTHQLRVHMAALGHPIVGDSIYSLQDRLKPSEMLPFLKPFQENIGCVYEIEEKNKAPIVSPEGATRRHVDARLHLHAEVLCFDHPESGERLCFVAPASF